MNISKVNKGVVSIFFNLAFAYVVWRVFNNNDTLDFPIAYLGGAVAMAVTFGMDKWFKIK